MKAYVMITGVVFALLALVHVWRIVVEGWGVANPWFIAITVVAAAISIWAWRVFFQMSSHTSDS